MYKCENVSARQKLTELQPVEHISREQAIAKCKEKSLHTKAVQVDSRTWIELPEDCENIEERICIWRNCHEVNH